MTVTLYPYQRRGVKKISEFGGRALLADEMGLGKTVQALTYLKENGLFPCLVVCPAYLKWHWEREANVHLGMLADVLSGMSPPKHGFGVVPDLIVVNYEILHAWMPMLCSLNLKLVIMDEVQYITNRGAKRTKAAKTVTVGVPHVIAITGTPIMNRPKELWPILNILIPQRYQSFYSFAHQFCQPERKPWGWVFNGAQRLGYLHRCLRWDCMIRRRKEDVLKDLPEKTIKVQPVDIKNFKEYEKARDSFLEWLWETKPHKAKSAARAEALTKIGYLKRLAAKLKMDKVFDFINDFLESSRGKLIVFGVHVNILEEMHKKYHYRSVLVNGKTPSSHRRELFQQFNKDKKTRLFFGNIQAAGAGWSCYSATDMLFAELAWRPADHAQAMDRIHGLGRGIAGKKANYTFLVGKNTIEEKICDILQTKQGIADKAIDGLADEREGLDLFTQLCESMMSEGKKGKR